MIVFIVFIVSDFPNKELPYHVVFDVDNEKCGFESDVLPVNCGEEWGDKIILCSLF